MERILNLVHELVVVNVAGTNDDDVVAIVVRGMEVADVVNGQALEHIAVTLDRLADHVLSVDVEVGVLNCGLKVALVVALVLVGDLKLGSLELGSAEVAAGDHLAEQLHSLANVVLEHLELVEGLFSIGLSLVAGAKALDGLAKLGPGVGVGAAEKSLLEKVGGTGSLEVLMARAGADEDAD